MISPGSLPSITRLGIGEKALRMVRHMSFGAGVLHIKPTMYRGLRVRDNPDCDLLLLPKHLVVISSKNLPRLQLGGLMGPFFAWIPSMPLVSLAQSAHILRRDVQYGHLDLLGREPVELHIAILVTTSV